MPAWYTKLHEVTLMPSFLPPPLFPCCKIQGSVQGSASCFLGVFLCEDVAKNWGLWLLSPIGHLGRRTQWAHLMRKTSLRWKEQACVSPSGTRPDGCS